MNLSSPLLPKNASACPYLILAPMEGVGDRTFRRAMASVGGFDEACTEFIRVPKNAHIPSLCTQYCVHETAPIPQAAQIMGSEASLMGAMAAALQQKGAPRIELNCGCPSSTVTGRGAGSSLLKTPELLHEIASAMVRAVGIPVTVKLHPRTKEDGYGPPARWDLIAEAKALLKIPVVGNGDILTVSHALEMLKQTRCDALMIGRGALMNPWLFHEIKAHFAQTSYRRTAEQRAHYFQSYIGHLDAEMAPRSQINKLKQIMSYFFKGTDSLLALRSTVLRADYENPTDFLEKVLALIQLSEAPPP